MVCWRATWPPPHAASLSASAEYAPHVPIKAGESQRLADELFDTRSKLRAAGRALHDEVGPLLSAAGIRLDLLRSDHPETAAAVELALSALEEGMECVRALSRELNPPPSAHLGLKRALSNLVEAQSDTFAGTIRFSYTATMTPPHDTIAAIYEAASSVLAWAAADRSATRLAISVRGTRGLIVAVQSNGRARWPRARLAAVARRVRPAGVVLDASTKKGTIVSIHYAARRSSRG
jgi:signal transduction histidine kinase